MTDKQLLRLCNSRIPYLRWGIETQDEGVWVRGMDALLGIDVYVSYHSERKTWSLWYFIGGKLISNFGPSSKKSVRVHRRLGVKRLEEDLVHFTEQVRHRMASIADALKTTPPEPDKLPTSNASEPENYEVISPGIVVKVQP